MPNRKTGLNRATTSRDLRCSNSVGAFTDQKSRSPWTLPAISKIRRITSVSNHLHPAVIYRQKTDPDPGYNIKPEPIEPRDLLVWTLTTTRMRTFLKLQWQDGSVTESSSLEVVPYVPMIR